MKAYRYVDTGHYGLAASPSEARVELQVCDVPDGHLVLELGCSMGPRGEALDPIVMIDRMRGVYRRRGGVEHPIPTHVVSGRDLTWSKA